MKIIGYSYNAATHCVDCTLKYAREVPYQDYYWRQYGDEDINAKSAMPGMIDLTKAIGLAIIRDNENNPLHPIYSISEAGDTPDHCDDCGVFIDTSWHGETVNYAISALKEFVTNWMNDERIQSTDVLDTWRESLRWCGGLSTSDDRVIELYDYVRGELDNE